MESSNGDAQIKAVGDRQMILVIEVEEKVNEAEKPSGKNE